MRTPAPNRRSRLERSPGRACAPSTQMRAATPFAGRTLHRTRPGVGGADRAPLPADAVLPRSPARPDTAPFGQIVPGRGGHRSAMARGVMLSVSPRVPSMFMRRGVLVTMVKPWRATPAHDETWNVDMTPRPRVQKVAIPERGARVKVGHEEPRVNGAGGLGDGWPAR